MKPANEGLAMVCCEDEHIEAVFCVETSHEHLRLRWKCRHCNKHARSDLGFAFDALRYVFVFDVPNTDRERDAFFAEDGRDVL